jgi:integrase
LAARKAARTRAAKVERLTFEVAARRYFDLHAGKWRNAKHQAQFLSTLTQYAFAHIGAMDVAELDTTDILRVIEPIWTSKTETASRVRQRIEKVLTFCIVRGYRQPPNPAAWVGHLKEALPARSQIAKVKHHAALPYSQLPEFMSQLRAREGFAARALELCILTAARTSEVTLARWSEINFDSKTWTIPAERMKAGREHRVPLSSAALNLLTTMPRDAEGDFIFPGLRKGLPLSNMAMAVLLKRMGEHSITVHGTARSTFSDWAHETTSYPNHVIEMALAHAIDNKTEAAYRRGDLLDMRRPLMEDWATYCGGQP